MAYQFSRYLNIRSAISPVISGDNQRLAYLGDATGVFQAWSIGLGETDAWPLQLTFFENKVWELHGTVAADHLIIVSDVNGNERQQFYLISNYGVTSTGQQQHDIVRLTSNDQAIHRFGAWGEDGQKIVYTSNGRNGLDFDYYLLDLASPKEHLLSEANGNRTIVAWSPDGQYLLVVEAVGSLQTELYLFDMVNQYERHLTANQPMARYWAFSWHQNGLYLLTDRLQDRGSFCRFDLDTGQLIELVTPHLSDEKLALSEFEEFRLADDGDTLAYTINIDGYSHLHVGKLSEKTQPSIKSLPQGVIGHLRFTPNNDALVFDLQTPTSNNDIWQVTLANNACERRTFSNRAGVDFGALVKPMSITYTSFDALSIPAYFYRPQIDAPSGGYPCILYVHGGPASQVRPDFDVRFQYFLAQGYAILATNVRGSSGYGRTYTALDEVEKRMDSVVDLEYAAKWLQLQSEINANRIAIYGRSYGGFMVLAALTEYPDLFAAGIDVVGIANWVTFLERTSAWRRSHREFEYGSLAHHRELLAQISPIHKADRIKAPLMVLAGDNDPRVPLSESEQVVERVRANGRIVEFIHYADEGHKFSKLANRVDSFSQMATFLQKYL